MLYKCLFNFDLVLVQSRFLLRSVAVVSEFLALHDTVLKGAIKWKDEISVEGDGPMESLRVVDAVVAVRDGHHVRVADPDDRREDPLDRRRDRLVLVLANPRRHFCIF